MTAYRTWIEVKKSAIAKNVRETRARIPDNVCFLGMVKGNAWGLGTVLYARCLAEAGVDWLGASVLEDALMIQKEGIPLPILVLSEFHYVYIEEALQKGLHLTVCTMEMARQISEKAVKLGLMAKIHVKINTGLNRIGVDSENAPQFITDLSKLPNLYLEGALTHFACADQPGDPMTEKQLKAFLSVVKEARERSIVFDIYHSANTPSAITLPETHLDMVRIGMGIAGLYPSSAFRKIITLDFPMVWKTCVSFIRNVKAGEPVGYGGKYKCRCDTTLVTIPVGDADGLSKRFQGIGYVLIRGRKYKIAAVSMDQTVIDLEGRHTDICMGEEVVILGSQGQGYLDPHTAAEEIGEDVEEMLCQISMRVPRIYI